MKWMLPIIAVATALFGDIYEVCSIKLMDKFREEGVLFIYDIDNTLITLDQMLGTDQWFLSRLDQLKKEMKDPQKALNKALTEWTAVQCISKVREVEEGSSAMIKSQQEDGVMCMALTTRGLAISDRTVDQIHFIGVDFTVTAPFKGNLVFHTTDTIIYKDGILFNSATHKGDALVEFFRQIDFIPKKVVFINDKHKHLASVEEGCNRLGIPFVGLRVNYLDKVVASFDPQIAKVQADTFFNILSDAQAALMIK